MLRPVNIFLIFCIVASRLLPHPPNFTPVIAIFMMSSTISLVPCLIAYMITDAIIGWHPYLLWVYSSLLLIGLFKSNVLASCIVFFVVTNFAVWFGSSYYTQDLLGLITCYVMAIPFFLSTLASTYIFYHMLTAFTNINIIRRTSILKA
jgi:hypothetical protein